MSAWDRESAIVESDRVERLAARDDLDTRTKVAGHWHEDVPDAAELGELA